MKIIHNGILFCFLFVKRNFSPKSVFGSVLGDVWMFWFLVSILNSSLAYNVAISGGSLLVNSGFTFLKAVKCVVWKRRRQDRSTCISFMMNSCVFPFHQPPIIMICGCITYSLFCVKYFMCIGFFTGFPWIFLVLFSHNQFEPSYQEFVEFEFENQCWVLNET